MSVSARRHSVMRVVTSAPTVALVLELVETVGSAGVVEDEELLRGGVEP